jgi:outer membrane protein assembly factor BamD
MKKTAYFAVAILVFSLGGTGCGKKQAEIAPEIATSDEALFEMGEQFIEKDPEKGRLYLRQVIDSFPKSIFAQRAKLLIADSYFDMGDEGSMIIARSEYQEFISLFPYSPSAPYAQYQVALTYFEKALKPGRDQTKTKQALMEFQRVVSNYSTSEEAGMARDKIKECEERLAEHNLSIGELYYKRKAFKAAVSRLNEILTEYPNFSSMDKVYFTLGDSYYQWNKQEEALPFFRKLITDYPESKYAEKAADKIEEIEELQQIDKF